MTRTGAPVEADWQEAGEARHVFTHFRLTLKVWQAQKPMSAPQGMEWVNHEEALAAAPTIGRKVLKLAL